MHSEPATPGGMPIHPVRMRIAPWLDTLAVLVLLTGGWRGYNAASLAAARQARAATGSAVVGCMQGSTPLEREAGCFRPRHFFRQRLSHSPLKDTKVNKLTTTLLATFLAIGSVSAFAADDMKKDSMAKDSMSKDSMAKEGMKKDGMAKDSMAKDSMSKDSMAKDGTKKDGMAKDSMAKDSMAKDSMSKDSMGKDGMKK